MKRKIFTMQSILEKGLTVTGGAGKLISNPATGRITTQIKPLSVNQGYTGKRYKTDAHRIWHQAVMVLLPRDYKVPEGKLEIYLKFGFSSEQSDWDNCVKFFQDCLSKKYNFNDKLIRRAVVEIDIVPAGCEYIQWELKAFNLNGKGVNLHDLTPKCSPS